MIRKHFETEDACGAVRSGGDRWDALRQSGRALVYVRYVPESGEYAFGITVDGKQVNVCTVYAPKWTDEAWRTSPKGYDHAARLAITFTFWEMEDDSDQAGMLSGMSAERFLASTSFGREMKAGTYLTGPDQISVRSVGETWRHRV